MAKVKILVVCGSGVACAMNVAHKLREYFKKEKLPAIIDGAGNNELAGRIGSYDMVLSNAQVTVKTDKPVFNAIPLLTGIGEKELVEKVIVKARELLEEKENG